MREQLILRAVRKYLAGAVLPVLLAFLLLVVIVSSIYSLEQTELKAGKSVEAKTLGKGGEYLYYVEADPQKMRAWCQTRCPGSPFNDPGQMEHFSKYGRQYDVNPLLVLAITGKESSFGTTGGGRAHKAPFNIVSAARNADWWPNSNSWRGKQNWIAYDSCPDYEAGIHDAALYLGSKYLHSPEDWVRRGFHGPNCSFYNTGGGSNPEWAGSGGVMGASGHDPSHSPPNILGVGIIYCVGTNQASTPEQWSTAYDSWPSVVRKDFNSLMEACGITSAPGTQAGPGETSETSVCLDPGHSPETRSETDPATGLDVGDNGGAGGEIEANFQMAGYVQSELEGMGYKVVTTKQNVGDYVNLRQRADLGNSCNIMVRLHFDPDFHAAMYPPAGAWRAPASNPERRTYVDQGVAGESSRLANVLAGHLSPHGVAGAHPDTSGTTQNNVDGNPTALVGSVLSKVPVACIENDPGLVSLDHGGTEATQRQVARATAEGISEYLGPPSQGDEEEEEEEDSAGGDVGRALVAEAKKHLGRPYVWGADGPDSFDCSGLVIYCMRQIGYQIPRLTTYTMRDHALRDGSWMRMLYVSSLSDLSPGDLIFRRNWGHVGIYVGAENGVPSFIHSPHSGDVVRIQPFNLADWQNFMRLAPPKAYTRAEDETYGALLNHEDFVANYGGLRPTGISSRVGGAAQLHSEVYTPGMVSRIQRSGGQPACLCDPTSLVVF